MKITIEAPGKNPITITLPGDKFSEMKYETLQAHGTDGKVYRIHRQIFETSVVDPDAVNEFLPVVQESME